MILLVNKYGMEETILQRKGDNLWEFTPRDFEEYDDGIDPMELTENSLLDKEGIEALLKGLKKKMKEKNQEEVYLDIQWKRNNANIKFGCQYREAKEEWPAYYIISPEIDCKYLKNFAYGQFEIELRDEGRDPKIYGRKSRAIFVTEENLKKYISELEKEIGE